MEIKVENVGLEIKGKRILQDVNASFSPGKIYGLVGNNGSGKTMLLKCICGFIRPTSGKIMQDGRQIGKEIDYIRDAGVIIENPEFISYYSGFKNLKILANISGKADSERVKECMKICGLDPLLKLPVRKYSMGMKQRLGIAQAIMESPKALILDEPFNGLDKHGTAEIRELLLEFKKQEMLIILVSHNANDISLLCDEVCEMDDGKMADRNQLLGIH